MELKVEGVNSGWEYQATNAAKKNDIDRNSELFKASREFEALFIKQMLNVMRKTVHKEGLLGGGFTEEIFEDMLYDEYAKKMAESAGFGLAEMITRNLSQSKPL